MADVDMIKEEPDEEMEDRLLEDDDFEGTDDLILPAAPPKAYLMRIPKILYENWSELQDDEEIQLGVLRRYDNGDEQRIILDPRKEQNHKVPKEYIVRPISDDLHNTFFFTEKDLPGYNGRVKAQIKDEDHGNPLGVAPQSGVTKRRTRYRKAVPKQTALSAVARKEATCVAVENEEYHRLMRERQRATDNKRKTNITILGGDPRQYSQSVLPTNLIEKNASGFDTFVKNTQATTKVKTQDNKASRIPRNELLDRLYDCFKRYKYWSMNALKTELHQPEAYLKEVLGSIAELVRSGSFSGQYKLRPEAEESNLQFSMKEEQAPEDEQMGEDEVPGAEDDSGDDGDEIQMEDP